MIPLKALWQLKNIMYKVKNVFISPIKAVLNDLTDMTVDYILCSSEKGTKETDNSNVLYLHFFDVEEENPSMSFQDSEAEKIVLFLSRPTANEDLFVCCDSGESRSPAIAAAILLATGKTDQYIWESTEYHPNRLVFKKMCRKLGIHLTDHDIKKRVETNNAVFHQAI